nr:MAG TPA: hypothetical protein [Caudoviricetes sp.]
MVEHLSTGSPLEKSQGASIRKIKKLTGFTF